MTRRGAKRALLLATLVACPLLSAAPLSRGEDGRIPPVQRVTGTCTDARDEPLSGAHVTIWAVVGPPGKVAPLDGETPPPAEEALEAALGGVPPGARELVYRAAAMGCSLVAVGEGETGPGGAYSIPLVSEEDGRVRYRLHAVATLSSGVVVSTATSEELDNERSAGDTGTFSTLKTAPLDTISVAVRFLGAPVESATVVIRQGIRDDAPPRRRWQVTREELTDFIQEDAHIVFTLATDAAGRASLPVTGSNDLVEVLVKCPGYAHVRDFMFRRDTNPSVHVDVDLEPEVTVTGTVVDPEGAPVASAVLHVYDGSSIVGDATTDAAGHFSIAELQQKNTYEVLVDGGAPFALKRVDLDTSEPTARIELERGGDLELTVRLGALPRDGLRRLRVNVDREDAPKGAPVLAHATLAEIGTAIPVLRIERAPPGRYRVRLETRGGFAPVRTEPVAVVASRTTAVQVTLRKGRKLQGRITNAKSERVDGYVTVEIPFFSHEVSSIRGDGRFSVEGIPPGEVTVNLQITGFKPKSIVVLDGKDDLGEVTLEKDDD